MKSDDTANAISPRSICPIFCYDWCQITWAFSVTYWNYFSQPDLAPLDLLSPANFKSDCAKSIKRVINLQISPVSGYFIRKHGVHRHQAQEKGWTQETISQKHSYQPTTSFSKQPFSTKRPPKAFLLSTILNIAEDKTACSEGWVMIQACVSLWIFHLPRLSLGTVMDMERISIVWVREVTQGF